MTGARNRHAGTAVVVIAMASSTVVAVDALSLDGLKVLYTTPKAAIDSLLGRHSASSSASSNATFFALSSRKAAQLMTCVWTGQFDSVVTPGDAAAAHQVELSPVLDGEESVRTYPSFPHAPVLVAASSCQSVVLRWKSFDDATWPVHKYILQRYPDRKHRNAWATLLETNNTEAYPDAHVRAGKLYSYRVQAISANNVSSAYAFDQVAVRAGSCNGGFFGLLPSQFPSWNMFSNWSCEAVRTLCLIVLCFLTVYALMRASVKRMQGTRSRNYRLKRIHKSAAEGLTHKRSANVTTTNGNGAMSAPKLTHRSSSDSSSTSLPSSEPMDPSLSQRSMESLSSVATRESLSQSSAADLSSIRESSFMVPARDRSTSLEKASACQNCQKRFGIFRRRHMCDICHAVTLCRKCGYQAPANFERGSLIGVSGGVLDESFIDTMPNANGNDGRSSLSRESLSRESSLTEGQRKVKIKTICRSCCEEVYRYSTAVRPSGFGPGAPQ